MDEGSFISIVIFACPTMSMGGVASSAHFSRMHFTRRLIIWIH
jgi:hypothetical protein